MNFDAVQKVVEAVLYEGYVLYPYRPSAVKNRQRWTFGGLYPRAYSDANRNVEPFAMQTECLLTGTPQSTVAIEVQFLHILQRDVRELSAPAHELPADLEAASRLVEGLYVGERLYQTWQEAVERVAVDSEAALAQLLDGPLALDFSFPARHDVEALRDGAGAVVGAIVREQQAVNGSVTISAAPMGDGVFKLTVRIENLTAWQAGKHDAALLRSLASTNTILGVRDGAFVSLMDPPAELKEIAAGCRNVGAWPVLAGAEGSHDVMLSSPIILYEYPQIAPESQGNLFDGTEIDEILTLRILTLTDDEKREMRAVDERARELLERSEALTAEQLMQLHGTLRYPMLAREDESGG